MISLITDADVSGLYVALKSIHLGTVVLSFTLFFLRGLWMLADSPLLRRRWVRIVPHLSDTVLLVSGVGLTIVIRQYPFVHPWLSAKILGLIVYILLGTVALKRGPNKPIRAAAWVGALATFGYIAAVALTREPLPPL